MKKGLVTIPTDKDFVEGTKKYIKLFNADAIRDCDGVSLPDDVKQFNTDVYKSYFIVREDREYAKNHPEYLQSVALMSNRHTAFSNELKINLLEGYYSDSLKVDTTRAKEFWQVFDRTTSKIHLDWEYKDGFVFIHNAIKFHEYTVNFFARNIWDPVQIYNYTSNNWTCEKDRDLDPIYPEARKHMLNRLENWLITHPDVTVVRFTTFFYNFLILYETPLKLRFWDWHSYSMSASIAMFDAFKKEKGYSITLEDIVTSGNYATKYNIPSKQTADYIDFVQRKCSLWAKEFVSLVHKYSKKAMMFDGDHRIGVEPYSPYFKDIGLDMVVAAPNNGVYIRQLSDIQNVPIKEARLAPYFFKNECPSDTEGTKMLKNNWDSERRAILRKPIDRIGFGGYLKLIDSYPNFVEEVKKVCDEFREIKENVSSSGSYTKMKVAILSYWGKQVSWMFGNTFVDDFWPTNNGYQELLIALSTLPIDVSFISFDDLLKEDLNKYDSLINIGLENTSIQGGYYWMKEEIVSKIRSYVYNGGSFFAMGDATGYDYQGHFFQLSDVLGVEKERGFTYNYRRKISLSKENNWLLEDVSLDNIKFGNQGLFVYPTTGKVLALNENNDVSLACNEYGKGRSIYLSSILPSNDADRLIYRCFLYLAHKEKELKKAFSSNVSAEVFYYESKDIYAIVNKLDQEIKTDFYDINSKKYSLILAPNELKWLKKEDLK